MESITQSYTSTDLDKVNALVADTLKTDILYLPPDLLLGKYDANAALLIYKANLNLQNKDPVSYADRKNAWSAQYKFIDTLPEIAAVDCNNISHLYLYGEEHPTSNDLDKANSVTQKLLENLAGGKPDDLVILEFLKMMGINKFL